MKLFENVLLVSDYDGTFVPARGGVTENVKRAVRFFMENGGHFTISTGRIHGGFRAYSPEYINTPVILGNGAMAFDYEKEQVLYTNGIGDEGVEAVRSVLHDFPQLTAEIFPYGQAYVCPQVSEQAEKHLAYLKIPYTRIDDPADAPRPWVKVMLGGPEEEIARVQEYLKDRFTCIGFLSTTGKYLEVLSRGTNKGVALLKLADALGVAHEDAYAIGDGYNDVEMLRAASIAFVPENGEPEALECADRIVRSNEEDAVAHAIEILTEIYRAKGRE